MLTILNCGLILVNLYCIGLSGKKLEIIEDKLNDLSMIEERIKHVCENLDSVFIT